MKVLIIDDERSIRNTLKEILEFEGHEISLAADGKEGLEMALAGNFDVIFCDIKMPGMDGVEVLEKLVENGVDSSVVMISGHGSIDTAVECIKKGAFDFIQKPLDLNRILITLKNATDKTTLIKETKVLKKKVAGIPEIVGESAPIVKIKEMIDRVAATDARVLITGSNGTGKELVARWLHEKSNRNTMPFIEVNCAAIPSELIESELFGHEKGAFTSAIKQHKGKFEQADGGTLFLDEIGDMSLAAQAKVLRVLQENKLTRVGSDKDISVKVRVVAATNKNLQEEIQKGNFREDLYHRLSVIIIHVPPLAERKDDIPLLVNHFIRLICEETGMPLRKINDDAMQLLQKHAWTGNIRELRNVTERLLILGGDVISKEDVMAYATPSVD
ncbi:MAG: sigma-54-dependent Fis family transcriptional regulator [Bacteroidales bacterium]|nr:sigma-54-dependent Fis family transcriptional regulator [Bacteroidales bacterium]